MFSRLSLRLLFNTGHIFSQIRNIHILRPAGKLTSNLTMSCTHHQLWDASGPKVAVVLSGSGVYDGTEVHEASSVIMALSRVGAEISLFAPDKPQMHVIDHTKGAPNETETRNVLVESARIARGKVTSLDSLKPDEHDAIIVPGGFGAAKNLSTFATSQAEMTVDPKLSEILIAFHSDKKPIGLCCIAPVIAARLFPGCEVTMGQEDEQGGKWPYSGATGAVKGMNSVHVPKEVDEIHVDSAHNIVTTPAFMCETKWHFVADGIYKMVSKIVEMTNK